MISAIHQSPFIIAGPCSAETEEQLYTIAASIAGKVNYMRAGIWKPRTRPGSFEGVGSIGLKWLKGAGDMHGLKTITEVANKKHVEEALKHGIDEVWIGARTASNPFSVQEIADSLKGMQIPVFVKNAINPDVNLWIGAIERIRNAGINEIAAIHRGFSSYEKTKYRNRPLWNIPIKLMQTFPELPVICDPSHICGDRRHIAAVSQKALDLNMSGLMIETHHEPEKALSDAKQQITPAALNTLLQQLISRTQYPKDGENFILEDLRKRIDEIDDILFNSLAERFQIVEDVAAYKKHKNMTVLQLDRWSALLEKRKQNAEALGLRTSFIEAFLEAIHNESVHKQTQIINEKTTSRLKL